MKSSTEEEGPVEDLSVNGECDEVTRLSGEVERLQARLQRNWNQGDSNLMRAMEAEAQLADVRRVVMVMMHSTIGGVRRYGESLLTALTGESADAPSSSVPVLPGVQRSEQ